MRAPNRQQLRLSGGTELSFSTAGESSRPAVLLLHGTPQSPAELSAATAPTAAQASGSAATPMPIEQLVSSLPLTAPAPRAFGSLVEATSGGAPVPQSPEYLVGEGEAAPTPISPAQLGSPVEGKRTTKS